MNSWNFSVVQRMDCIDIFNSKNTKLPPRPQSFSTVIFHPNFTITWTSQIVVRNIMQSIEFIVQTHTHVLQENPLLVHFVHSFIYLFIYLLRTHPRYFRTPPLTSGNNERGFCFRITIKFCCVAL